MNVARLKASKPADFTWAIMCPLIGGLPLAMEQEFGTMPEYIASFPGFFGNDKHYYADLRKRDWKGTYYVLGEKPADYPSELVELRETEGMWVPSAPTGSYDPNSLPDFHVDVLGAVPPCAGLSSLSCKSCAESATNDWMYKTAEFALGTVKPKVFWGENAPRLGTDKGKPVADKLYEIGQKHGYSLTIFCTESRLCGNPQKRPRTFYLFVDKSISDGSVLLNTKILPALRMEDLLKKLVPNKKERIKDEMWVPINDGTPSDDPHYKWLYEHLGATSYRDFVEKVCPADGSVNLIVETIERSKWDYEGVAKWMEEHGFDKTAARFRYMKMKSEDNKVYWTHGISIARGESPAFVGVLPYSLVHPEEDRYVTIREGLSIMRMPTDFNLATKEYVGKKPLTEINHVCQNVPLTTAAMIAGNIREIMEGEVKSAPFHYCIQNHRKGIYDHRDTGESATLDEFFS